MEDQYKNTFKLSGTNMYASELILPIYAAGVSFPNIHY